MEVRSGYKGKFIDDSIIDQITLERKHRSPRQSLLVSLDVFFTPRF